MARPTGRFARSSHHFSHHLGVTGWTSRLRLGLCFRSVGTARYGLLRHSVAFTRWKPKVQSLQRPQKNGHLGGSPGWPFQFLRPSHHDAPSRRSSRYFASEEPDAELMSYSELRDHVSALQAGGFNVVPGGPLAGGEGEKDEHGDERPAGDRGSRHGRLSHRRH